MTTNQPAHRTKASSKKIRTKREDLQQPGNKSKLRAVALKYDLDKGKAPKILATGKGSVAEMILQVAEENRVPFYEDESLADLLSKLDLETEIPGELYTLVAEVLAFVYQLDKLAKKRQSVKQRHGKKNAKKE